MGSNAVSGEPLRDTLGRRIPNRVRHYTNGEKAHAVGLALTIGSDAAAEQLGIPRRNLSRWRRSPAPAVQAAIVASEEAIGSSLETAAAAGAATLVAVQRDPKASNRDKLLAADIALRNHTLWSGRATARTESYVVSEERQTETADLETRAEFLRAIVDASDEERRQYLAEHGIDVLRQIAGGDGDG